MFIGRTDDEAETPILWPPHAKSWLIGKDSDAGRDWGQEEKGMTEDEMAGWHHWLDGRESGWTPRVGDGQEGLACCDLWGCKESDTTERLNWTEWGTPFFSLAPQIKYPPATAEDTGDAGWSLKQEDPLEDEIATHSLLGEAHGQRSLVGYSPWGHSSRSLKVEEGGKRESEISVTMEEESEKSNLAGLEDGERCSTNTGSSRNWKSQINWLSPEESRKECSPDDTLISAA